MLARTANWLPVLMTMAVTFFTSSIPGSRAPALFPFQDATYHFYIFFLLALLFACALKNTFELKAPNIIFITFIFGLSWGLSDELHQFFVPLRSTSGLDVFIDSLATFAGAMFKQWQK